MHCVEFDSLMERPLSLRTGYELVVWVDKFLNHLKESTDWVRGILTKEDVEKVPVALKRAAECGIAEAWKYLGDWEEFPMFGCGGDLELALLAYEKAMELGVRSAVLPYAKRVLGNRILYYSDEQASDAYRLVEQLVEQEPNNAEAVYFLSELYGLGFGVESDPKMRKVLHQRAADLGCIEAIMSIASDHFQAKPPEVERGLAALERAAGLSGVHGLSSVHVAQSAQSSAAWARTSFTAASCKSGG